LRSLDELLANESPQPIVHTDERTIVLDLSVGSDELGAPLAGLDVAAFSEAVKCRLAEAGTGFAYGRWGERRELYRSELFNVADPYARRDIHMGVDVFCAPGTPVHAPLPGRVLLAANNARELDYGPVVILQHGSGSDTFHTLYGHLTPDTLSTLRDGQDVAAGETIARVGAPPENGNWAPHLHFQPILDLLGLGADFPGVCSASEQEKWLALSPLPTAFFSLVAAESLNGRSR